MQQRPHPERVSERFGEQNEIVEVTMISSKNQILQRTGDQILQGFAQDSVQQRLVEQSFAPQTMEQLEEVPKMVSQNGVLPEPISERICGQRGCRRDRDLKPRPEFAEYTGPDSRGLHG